MLTHNRLNLDAADPSWRPYLINALAQMDPDYLKKLNITDDWLPGHKNIFNAFSLPIDKTRYVLFGESPYPRADSANGYAFWDNKVTNLWSDTGLSKTVNRATSLRNIIKMLLVAEGRLNPNHTTQPDIAILDKNDLIQSNAELFNQLLQHGFLLLNATLVLRSKQVRKDALAWHPFIKEILTHLLNHYPDIQLILFGSIANIIDQLIPTPHIKKLYAEHPYNLSFIQNQDVIRFFQPLHLLRRDTIREQSLRLPLSTTSNL